MNITSKGPFVPEAGAEEHVKTQDVELPEVRSEDRLGRNYSKKIEDLRREIVILENKLEERKRDERVKLNSNIVKQYIQSNERLKKKEKERLRKRELEEGTQEALRDLEEFSGIVFSEVRSEIVKKGNGIQVYYGFICLALIRTMPKDSRRHHIIEGVTFQKPFRIEFDVPEYGDQTPITDLLITVDEAARDMLGDFVFKAEVQNDVSLFLTGFSSFFRAMSKRNSLLKELLKEYGNLSVLSSIEDVSLKFSILSSMMPNPLVRATFSWSISVTPSGEVRQEIELLPEPSQRHADSSDILNDFTTFFRQLCSLKGATSALKVVCSFLYNLETM